MTAIKIDELLHLTLERAREMARPPVSTYRVQFHAGFRFKAASAIVPYLAELGITHVYASPYLAAVAGSMHGYDVIDPTRLNPELGSEQDYEEFLATLKRFGMSHILDMVPNHMGVETNDNHWWNSVLELGKVSPFGKFFDIRWEDSCDPAMQDRVLIPTLGEPYGRALENGQLRLGFERTAGRFYVEYFKRRFPIDPATAEQILRNEPHISDENIELALASFNGTAGDARSFDRLDALLRAQHYRLAWWRLASQEINYRRFFDINGLAALAMEREEVFAAVHRFVLELAAAGKIAGLRIDHPDGLYDPAQYFQRLQKHYLLAIANRIARERLGNLAVDWEEFGAVMNRTIDDETLGKASTTGLYVVAEKILAMNEELPAAWACGGTSGYDFLIMVNALFVDRSHEKRFTQIYQTITGSSDTFAELAYQKKKLVLEQSFGADLASLAGGARKLAAKTLRGRDFTFQMLRDALRELIASFPVYRTYINSNTVSAADQSHLEAATKAASGRNSTMSPDLFAFICDLLLQIGDDAFDEHDRKDQLRFAGSFQQLTSPATAKGVEDTAFYVYQRLISLNEVGGEASRFGIDTDELHRYLSMRRERWPFALSVLSTHDTKRSEDVRARINVLSEMPDEWEAHVSRWMAINAKHRRAAGNGSAPAADEEYLLYQTLIGIWPIEDSGGGAQELTLRMQQFMLKAMREAKLRTSWTEPDERWESAVRSFVADVLDPNCSSEFIQSISSFAGRVGQAGVLNSLAQTLLRIAAPGVPDTYQGTELWDFSLVDPDNRRPVDYPLRDRICEKVKAIEMLPAASRATVVRNLLEHAEDGAIKLWTIRRALHCRRSNPELFTSGEYVSVDVTGLHATRVFAFARLTENRIALCVVPRLTSQFTWNTQVFPVGASFWGDTQLRLPEEFKNRSIENMLTGERVDCGGSAQGVNLMLSKAFTSLPIALFITETLTPN
jgi:(1->4)-alpha-D-glucan 1-alpha-D-glucosylmutase